MQPAGGSRPIPTAATTIFYYALKFPGPQLAAEDLAREHMAQQRGVHGEEEGAKELRRGVHDIGRPSVDLIRQEYWWFLIHVGWWAVRSGMLADEPPTMPTPLNKLDTKVKMVMCCKDVPEGQPGGGQASRESTIAAGRGTGPVPINTNVRNTRSST